MPEDLPTPERSLKELEKENKKTEIKEYTEKYLKMQKNTERDIN